MAKLEIKTPRGAVIQGANGKARLIWNPQMINQRTGYFTRAQKFVDSEVLRRCSPMVPFQTGTLEKSGKLGTVVGSGEVNYIAPYAAKQYYDTAESRPYDPQRGGRWFERMKVSQKEEILEAAKKV